jgi:hypothetical protein
MGYILMKLVKPHLAENFIVKEGVEMSKQTLISELGVFGAYIA